MSDTFESMITLIIVIILLALMSGGVNYVSEDQWNDGFCPTCNTRYVLRGVEHDLKYYSCPVYGREVKRYH